MFEGEGSLGVALSLRGAFRGSLAGRPLHCMGENERSPNGGPYFRSACLLPAAWLPELPGPLGTHLECVVEKLADLTFRLLTCCLVAAVAPGTKKKKIRLRRIVSLIFGLCCLPAWGWGVTWLKSRTMSTQGTRAIFFFSVFEVSGEL